MPAYILRPVHVAFALALVFLLFPAAKRVRHRLMWYDVIFAVASIAIVVYVLWWGDEFGDRATMPTGLDEAFGVALIVLILEANRRSSTWILPFICVLFIAYALFGSHLPPPWTHRDYEVGRLIGTHAIGPHHLSRLVLPSMRTRPRGDIVMVSSVGARTQGANGAPYGMGKAAM